MEKRCIFCMKETVNEQGVCTSCGKSQWEYAWNRRYLAPYARLQEKYILGAVLGAGGFGVTYTGFDTVLKHRIAVKEFFPQRLASRSQDGASISVAESASELFEAQKQAFRTESLLLSGSLGTPGVCNVIDFFEENGTAYIIEEYLPGQTLGQYLSERHEHKISWEQCRELFAPVLTGLCHIHSLGIVHCDISPDNLMFDGDGFLKLIDFGAARQTTDIASRRGSGTSGTDDGQISGTARQTGGSRAEQIPGTGGQTTVGSGESKAFKEAYAAPEQYGDDSRRIGPWTDLYSVCAVMYLALTGEKPASSLARIRRQKTPAISPYAVVPQEIESAILQGMDLDIRRRYFFTGILMERLGMDAHEVRPLAGRFRNEWGDAWLEIFTQDAFSADKKGLLTRIRRWLTKDRLKHLLIGTAGTATACLFLCLALFVYARTHPVQVFHFLAKQEQAQARRVWRQADGQNPFLIQPDTDRYGELLELLSYYEQSYSEYNKTTTYFVPSSFLVRQNLVSGEYHEFPLQLSLTERLLGYYLDQSLEIYYSDGSCTVSSAPGQPLGIDGFVTNRYKYRTEKNSFENIGIGYDAVTLQVAVISIDGYREDITIFLRDLFPYLVPETYLTDEEIAGLFSEAEAKSGDSVFVDNHARFALSLYVDSQDNELIHLSLQSDPGRLSLLLT